MNLKYYLIASAVVWAGILIATAVLLKATPYLPQLLAILGAGVVWFIILTPALSRGR